MCFLSFLSIAYLLEIKFDNNIEMESGEEKEMEKEEEKGKF